MLKRITTFLLFAAGGAFAQNEGYFWHVTDFHWDFSYWSDQLSCNGMNISNPGIFGDHWCDSPWRLVEETIKGIKKVKPDVDFILWTGDTVPHVSDNHLSVSLNEELVENVTKLMENEFSGVTVYATFGNHDYYPAHKFPPHGNDIYNATYALWNTWINDPSQEQFFLKGGYYSALVRPGLRIVALNTNLYYTKDTVTPSITDPADQFSWLDSVLSEAARNNEKVILAGHVPTGFTTPRAVRWMTETFNKKLNEIVLKHTDIIVAMHFGHEHHDNFRMYYDAFGTPKVALFIAPSVTPWRYRILGQNEPMHQPGVRLIKYNRENGRQLDILQYYVDLDQSNAARSITWLLGYKATSLYGIPDITPASMDTLINKMTNISSPEFKAYVNWYNTNGEKNFPCDERCHKSVMCGLRNLEQENFYKCLQSPTMFHCAPNAQSCLIVGR